MPSNLYASLTNLFKTFKAALEGADVVMGKGDLKQDAWGTQRVVHDISLGHGLFTFDVPASQWLFYENGTEVVSSSDITSVNGMLSVVSNTTSRSISSRRHARYQPNRGHKFSASMIFPSPDADGIRDFGLFTDQEGVFFRLKPSGGTGTLYAVRRYNSVDVQEEAITVPFTIDLSKGNIFDIQMQWRGVGNIKFYIGNPATGVSECVHVFNLLGTLTTLSTRDPALPVSFKSTYTTEAVTMLCGCDDLTSEGGQKETEEYGSVYSENVTVNGTDVPVIVLKQPLLINTMINSRDVRLARITVTCSKKSTFKVWVTRSAAAITGATYKPLGNGSFIETDSTDMDATAVRATSVTTSSMKFITSIPVEQTVRAEVTNPSRETIQFFLVRGDYLVVTCTASTAAAECVVEFGEEI
jgi:hypothetical protein